LNIIKKQRKEKTKEKFEGSFLDYLSLLQKNPDFLMLAHKRLYSTIIKSGFKTIDIDHDNYRDIFNGEKIRTYSYFEKEFFGMESVINKLMRYLKSASFKGEESRQVLLLMGPVGAGKSALTEAIKSALESADYFYHLKDCPIKEEPLHLLPRSLRSEFEELLGISIEGDLCPVCRHKLIHEYNGKYENFPVVQSSFSQRGRREFTGCLCFNWN
jgi:serine protein kinase